MPLVRICGGGHEQSWSLLRLLGEAIELGKQSFPVPGGEFGDVLNKGSDLLAAGLTEVLGAAELGCILLDQGSIQTLRPD